MPGPAAATRAASRALLAGGVPRIIRAVYDFAVDGGAQGTINFKAWVPDESVITRIITTERTTLTSGGAATLQLQYGSGPTAITDALAFDTAFTGGGNTHTFIGGAEALLVTARSQLKMAIATADLTAGKVEWFVEYIKAKA